MLNIVLLSKGVPDPPDFLITPRKSYGGMQLAQQLRMT